MNRRLTCALVFLLFAAMSVGGRSLRANASEEELWRYRNLGKAFYENPTTQYEAVEQFRQALDLAPQSARERVNYALALLRAGKTDEGIAEMERVQRQDPSLPHSWFNLGIQYKKQGTPESNARAIAQFERMIQLAPEEPISHYNLGYLYKIGGRTADALRHFETAARLDPNLAGPHFQLYNAYRDPQVGRRDDAARELATFQAIKKRQAGAVIPEDLEWSYYSEIYDPVDPADSAPDPAPILPSFSAREVLRAVDAESARLVVLSSDADERPDLIVWSSNGVRLLAGGDTAVAATGLESLTDVTSIAPADFDNDGATDLAVIRKTGASVWRGSGSGSFTVHTAVLPGGDFARAFWVDYDHDYDVDLMLLGARSYLLRNAGDARFTDVSHEFPFVAGHPLDAVLFEAVADTIGHDVVVSYADRSGVLYRDRLAGKYEAIPLDALPAGTSSLLAHDINRDSWIDIAGTHESGPLLLLNAQGRLASAALPRAAGRALAAVDFENLGVTDLIAGDRLLRWTVAGIRDVALDVDAIARAAADFNADGRVDLASLDRDGTLRVLTNTSPSKAGWLRVALTGVKNLKAAPGAEVEVKAGARYQKALYLGVPLVFGLGTRDIVDTVRITWPNGLIQNEARQPVARTAAYKEAPRLSGSCPMIFTWDGQHFRFITDVLGVAPLGASAGDGEYFPVDHDEYVHIPGDAVALKDGHYEVRVTEELREVSYLDRIELLALDYPSHLTVVTNDKFKGPPFPEFRLYAVERPIAPRSARNHRGVDLLERVRTLDRQYADGYRRDFEGVAETHHLELDFGEAAPDNRALLVLTGWVDWADGSTFRGVSQEHPQGLILPHLQVKDTQGRWRTVIDDMGLPAGKTKTIAVDLTGKFLSASREVRIVTNLCVYWDQIYLSERTDAPDVALTRVDASAAALRFRGFSRLIADPERRQPETFDYADVSPMSMWNPTPGLYTRYGDVRALLARTDDDLVIMGSGDELRLLFDPTPLPDLPAGWRRDFLLLFDGWAKDGDANTAFSQSVEPLPFHAMSAYPYGDQERHPRAHLGRDYQTRPALRLVRPLAPKEAAR
jgi:Tfp pilus assembly protein PilF